MQSYPTSGTSRFFGRGVEFTEYMRSSTPDRDIPEWCVQRMRRLRPSINFSKARLEWIRKNPKRRRTYRGGRQARARSQARRTAPPSETRLSGMHQHANRTVGHTELGGNLATRDGMVGKEQTNGLLKRRQSRTSQETATSTRRATPPSAARPSEGRRCSCSGADAKRGYSWDRQ